MHWMVALSYTGVVGKSRGEERLFELTDARIGLTLRAGRMADSKGVARRVSALERMLCAAPSHFALRPVNQVRQGGFAIEARKAHLCQLPGVCPD